MVGFMMVRGSRMAEGRSRVCFPTYPCLLLGRPVSPGNSSQLSDPRCGPRGGLARLASDILARWFSARPLPEVVESISHETYSKRCMPRCHAQSGLARFA